MSEGTRRTLSEVESKALLAEYAVPLIPERVVADAAGAVDAAGEVLAGADGAVVLKLCGVGIAHKSERGLVRLNCRGPAQIERAAAELLAAARPEDGEVGVLVAPMVGGIRELIVGMVRDPQFGPNVMLGLGGVLSEALGDVVFRPAPLDADQARAMLDEFAGRAVLGALRGHAAADRGALVGLLVGLGRLAAERADIESVDLNPVILDAHGAPWAVDALVELNDHPAETAGGAVHLPPMSDERGEGFRAMFDPRGVVVAGVSSHPGKFGFVALHNLLAAGYPGRVVATNLSGEPVLGVDTITGLEQLGHGEAELIVVCTPASANIELLRAAAARGVRAAFVTSAGYGEAGPEGFVAQRELAAVADEVGLLLAGPNGQGLVSTPSKLCAQIVAPYPPAGHIGIASQSGNLVSSFLNLACWSGVGVSRAVSAGNAASLGPVDYLEWFATDEHTRVGLTYLEGVADGASFLRRLGAVTARMPVVVLKGGTTSAGARAAASHTGALASDERVFAGGCRQAGVTVAHSVEEAFAAAATFATQPVPVGNRVAVLTTVGGWGVLTSDQIAADGVLQLAQLSDALLARLNELLPPRWSKNNPIDCAGGETRDTIPEVLDLLVADEGVDAVILLGVGIQSNQASLARRGPFYPEHGLERIVGFHERQDARYAEAAAAASERSGKPVLVATELAVTDPANAAVAAVRASGRFCYPSGPVAARALAHLVADAARRRARG